MKVCLDRWCRLSVLLATCATAGKVAAGEFIEVIELKQESLPEEQFYDGYLLEDGSVLLGSIQRESSEKPSKVFLNLGTNRAHRLDSDVRAPLSSDGLLWLKASSGVNYIVQKERYGDACKEIQKFDSRIAAASLENKQVLGEKGSRATLWSLETGAELWQAPEERSVGLVLSRDSRIIGGRVSGKPAYWKRGGEPENVPGASYLSDLPKEIEGAITTISRDGTRMFGYYQRPFDLGLLKQGPEAFRRVAFVSESSGRTKPLKESLLEGYEKIRQDIVGKIMDPAVKEVYRKDFSGEAGTRADSQKFREFVKNAAKEVLRNLSLEQLKTMVSAEDAGLIKLYHEMDTPIQMLQTYRLYSVEGISSKDDFILCGAVNEKGELAKYFKLRVKHNGNWIVQP
jgi:hypothetical protein